MCTQRACHAQHVDSHPSSLSSLRAHAPSSTPPGDGAPAWLKATASGTGNCLEARRVLDRVQVRDSKHPHVSVEFTELAWVDLVESAKTGELDLDRLPESWPT